MGVQGSGFIITQAGKRGNPPPGNKVSLYPATSFQRTHVNIGKPAKETPKHDLLGSGLCKGVFCLHTSGSWAYWKESRLKAGAPIVQSPPKYLFLFGTNSVFFSLLIISRSVRRLLCKAIRP